MAAATPGIPDAPVDDQTYGRRNASWTVLPPPPQDMVGPTQQLVLDPPWVPPNNVLNYRLALGGNAVQLAGIINYGTIFPASVLIGQLPPGYFPAGGAGFNYGLCAAATGSGAPGYALLVISGTGQLWAYNAGGLSSMMYVNNFFDITL